VTRRILISGSMVLGGLAGSLKKAFERSGWTADGFDDVKPLIEQGRWATQRYVTRLFWRRLAHPVQTQLLSAVAELKPSILLVLKGFYYSPETLVKIRKMSPGTVLMHFNPDNTFNHWHFSNSNAWIRDTIPLYDIHLTWGEFLIPQLRAAGAKQVFYLPFACDPDLHHPISLNEAERSEFGADVSFVGTCDKEREWWLSHLLDYRLKIWGGNWEKAAKSVRAKWQRKFAIEDDFSKVCDASKINLNFIRKENVPAHNMRTFEIPACGGFMLATRTSEQETILAEGEGMACFSTPEELRNALDRYLADDQTRSIMASCARDRISRFHSYTERARQIESIYLSYTIGRG